MTVPTNTLLEYSYSPFFLFCSVDEIIIERLYLNLCVSRAIYPNMRLYVNHNIFSLKFARDSSQYHLFDTESRFLISLLFFLNLALIEAESYLTIMSHNW